MWGWKQQTSRSAQRTWLLSSPSPTASDLIDQKKFVEIRTYSQKFTNNPNEKFLLMILGSQAKLENDQKGLNVKRGLRTRCEMGLRPGPAPTGYLNERRTDRKCHVIVDPKRASIIKQVFEKVAYERCSGRKIYSWLKDIDFRSVNGKYLTLSNIYVILKNPFYYGEFEYPLGSDTWYQGIHTALISKELYLKVQEKLTLENKKLQPGSKEFAFTKLKICGLCGSGITAEEKYRKLVGGGFNIHIYYGCGRSKDHDCKCGYIREDELIKQMCELIDEIDLDKAGLKQKLQRELERFHRFQDSVLGVDPEKIKKREVDMRNYAKYILKEGTIFEKRDLMGCLRSKLMLKEKRLSLS
jgi:hypothetical protein